jgi:hypothetical protein
MEDIRLGRTRLSVSRIGNPRHVEDAIVAAEVPVNGPSPEQMPEGGA